MNHGTRLKEPAIGAVQWTGGFWGRRFELCHNTIVPNMGVALEHPDNAAVLQNFYVAAGLKKGGQMGVLWGDGDCYKWIESMAHVYAITKDPALDRRMDEIIEVIGKAQDPDGYICTQIQLSDKKRWELRGHHELYNFGHLLTAASVHKTATGKDNFLEIGKKAADYLYSIFAPRPRNLAHYGWNPSNIMGLVDLYRASGDKKYIELAGIFVDMRGSAPEDFDSDTYSEAGRRDIGDQNQDRVPLRQENHAVGHAVTATYLYAGAADVFFETGEKPILDSLVRIWQDVTKYKQYITGGVGPYHHGLSIRSDRVHEAFAGAYDLPQSTAYNETCANIGNAMWNFRMLKVQGDAVYADEMERVLYNSMLSAMSIDGKLFRYSNPLRWYGKDHQLLSNDTMERWFVHSCYCCPPQVARTIAGLYNLAYSISDDAVWVNIFGDNEIETPLPGGEKNRIRLRQGTDYPWDGLVTITIEDAPPDPLTLNLRIPGWCESSEITINDEKWDGDGKGGSSQTGMYAALHRSWKKGDKVVLRLDMKVRLMTAHHRVEEATNQVAIMRGPVVYCLEAVDLPDGVRMEEIHIPTEVSLQPVDEKDLLGGITVLEGEAVRIIYRPNDEEDTEDLYTALNPLRRESIDIRLIPYYAWGNRGISEMSVWLPLA